MLLRVMVPFDTQPWGQNSPLLAASSSGSPGTGSDVALLTAASGGDQAALGELYDEHAARVFGTALRILGDHARAEEVTQDVFLAVWNRGDSFNAQRGSVRAWLATCARNRSIDLLRGGRARAARQEEDLPPSLSDGLDVFHSVARSIDAQVVQKALNALPAEQRQVIVHCYFRARTQLEAAAEMGVPLSTIKGRSRLALQKLAGLLEGSVNWSPGS